MSEPQTAMSSTDGPSTAVEKGTDLNTQGRVNDAASVVSQSPAALLAASLQDAPTWKLWWLAARPKTLTAAAAPVAVGAAVAWASDVFALLPVLAALMGALWIQVGTNFANDYYDFKKGADTEERMGPTRVTQAGLISEEDVFKGTVLAFVVAFLIGIYLVVVGGLPIVAIGIASIICGVAYTGGPYPLGYNGLGDLFVFLFFGVIAVCGTYWVQHQEWSNLALVASLPVGFLSAAIIVVNNLRDADTDVKAGKKTLAVRFGKGFCKAEYVALIVASYGVTIGMAAWMRAPFFLLPLLTIPEAFRLTRSVFNDQGSVLNATLGGTARLLLIFSLVFSAAFVGSKDAVIALLMRMGVM